ncbi:MAG: hypothetical protein CIT03_01165 [Methanobacterium sp.]|nr:MAG: hypothetical protein CIT03_01165 [Methanobacterium sp.]
MSVMVTVPAVTCVPTPPDKYKKIPTNNMLIMVIPAISLLSMKTPPFFYKWATLIYNTFG